MKNLKLLSALIALTFCAVTFAQEKTPTMPAVTEAGPSTTLAAAKRAAANELATMPEEAMPIANEGLEAKEAKTPIAETPMPEKAPETVAAHLMKLLTQLHMLYHKTLAFHWNVEGKHFLELHKFFGNLYEKQQDHADRIAERIRALGEKIVVMADQLPSPAFIAEKSAAGAKMNESEMTESLLSSYQMFIAQLKAAQAFADENNDSATANFLTELVFKYEKTSWMLKALLAK